MVMHKQARVAVPGRAARGRRAGVIVPCNATCLPVCLPGRLPYPLVM